MNNIYAAAMLRGAMARKASKSTDSALGQYPLQHLAVDLALVTVGDVCLKVLLMERGEDPFAGRLVLPEAVRLGEEGGEVRTGFDHELILARAVNNPHFRTKMLGRTFPDGGQIVPTGEFSRSGWHRPAELYRLG